MYNKGLKNVMWLVVKKTKNNIGWSTSIRKLIILNKPLIIIIF